MFVSAFHMRRGNMEHGNDEPSRPEGTGAFSSREDGPSECGPGTVRAVRDWIKKRLDLIRLCLEQAGESVRDLHGVALWLLVLILTVTGSVILVFSPFGSDSATRQPMVSSATRSRFRAAGRFWMISRMSSMASTKFLMYSMCRGMRSLAMFMLAADSGRPSICVRCPVSTMPTRNWPCRWSATGSPMSPRRRRVSVFAEPTISRPYESGLVTPDMRVSGCNHYGYHAGKRLVIGNAWGYV